MTAPVPSARQNELLEAAYQHVLEHGIGDLSLRPLATAIGSSPRVLLYLYGDKDGLVRALLERARRDELHLLASLEGTDLAETARELWRLLCDPEPRPVLTLWVEVYGRSLVDPAGPWGGFAAQTVTDWLDLLARHQPPRRRRTAAGRAERTWALAVLRGCVLDLLATGDVRRTTAAVESALGTTLQP